MRIIIIISLFKKIIRIVGEFPSRLISFKINVRRLLILNACYRICGAAVVTWVSAGILVVLFLMQRFGTNRIGFLFSPVILTWVLITPVIGVYNIAKYYPSIFKAISPHYFIQFFKENQRDGWVALGGVVLCITGICGDSRAQLTLRLHCVKLCSALASVLITWSSLFFGDLSPSTFKCYEILLAGGVIL